MTEAPYTPAAATTDLSLLGEAHVRLYRETNGERGYIWNGVPILLLTTTGRHSGQDRTIPIIYTSHDKGWIIVASRGGSPTHPAWYLNILNEPNVRVQIKANHYAAVARASVAPEREQLWARAVKTWPSYDVYQSRTTRQIPVVFIEPVHELQAFH